MSDPKPVSVSANLPVLVYRTPDMTDEQAESIQDFVHEVMTRA